MSYEIIEETNFFLYSVCAGIIVTLAYDFIRLLREVIPHNGFFTAVEDILFWIFTSCCLFLMLHEVNNGTIRWFVIAGAFLGMIIYKKSFGQYIVGFMSTIIKKLLHIAKSALNLVFKPLLRVSRKVRNLLTDMKKKVKMFLCKHKNPDNGEVEL